MTNSNVKPTLYLLNAPILTHYGLWRFDGPITLIEAHNYLKNGFVSGIGHQATADYLTALLSIHCPFNRQPCVMQAGDLAIVLRLLCRLPEGKLLEQHELSQTHYHFGLLQRLE